ncbi:MAG: gamma-glutamyl-gamma-aminobutyrate hydrolase family protein [Alphaproteobacteria bacterium]|nr:gamma-glutamyl-gamma-aminobutyrate hydrolase family protein [Alphaproteobacteria bacterium]
MTMRRPVIGVSACVKAVQNERLAFHAAPAPYIEAAAQGSGGLPLLIPALGDACDEILASIDGLLLSGSKSNVGPGLYGQSPADAPPYDAARDSTTLPLARAALAAGVPLLAICRGIQELNVALGGSLHARVHAVAGFDDHRSDPSRDLDGQFGPAHPVSLTPGGLLAKLAGATSAEVNSLHGQGIDRLAPGLIVEARAPDGLVEAVRVEGADAFALAVQWHPEWDFRWNPLSAAMFRAFGAAASARAMRRAHS